MAWQLVTTCSYYLTQQTSVVLGQFHVQKMKKGGGESIEIKKQIYVYRFLRYVIRLLVLSGKFIYNMLVFTAEYSYLPNCKSQERERKKTGHNLHIITGILNFIFQTSDPVILLSMYLCCLCKNTITFIFYSNSCNPKTDHLFLWTVFLDFSTSFYNTVNGKQNCIPKFNFPHIPNLLTLINSF